jgi:ketosteroid isomerase-like protein
MMMTTAAKATSITKIAHFLVDSCRKGDFKATVEHYYDDKIVNVEAMGKHNKPMVKEGIKEVKKSSEEWHANNEVHSIEVSDPIISETHFAVKMKKDVTCKTMDNKRVMMEEIAVYEVQNGKIVHEQFFYNTQNSH